MSIMSLLLARLHTGREALRQMRDVFARAKAAGGTCPLSAQEQKDILAVLTPLAGAVNDRYVFSPHVNCEELAALLRERYDGEWAVCRDAVTAAESRIRSGGEPLGEADIATLRFVADALAAQCSYLSARTGGY